MENQTRQSPCFGEPSPRNLTILGSSMTLRRLCLRRAMSRETRGPRLKPSNWPSARRSWNPRCQLCSTKPSPSKDSDCVPGLSPLGGVTWIRTPDPPGLRKRHSGSTGWSRRLPRAGPGASYLRLRKSILPRWREIHGLPVWLARGFSSLAGRNNFSPADRPMPRQLLPMPKQLSPMPRSLHRLFLETAAGFWRQVLPRSARPNRLETKRDSTG